MTEPTVLPVTVTWHCLEEERVHELGDRVALPVPVNDHATSPAGDDPPTTVALQVIDEPTTADGLVQLTLTLTVSAWTA